MRNGMSCSESGKLGAKKSAVLAHQRHIDCLLKYNENPKTCKYCGKPLAYKHRHYTFCSHSCAARNSNMVKMVQKCNASGEEGEYQNGRFNFRKKCVHCGNEYLSRHKNSKFCTFRCSVEYRMEMAYKKVDENGEFPASNATTTKGEANREFIRSYLENRFGHRCSKCGITEWNGEHITFIVDHIDGNAYNNKINNVRLICPNCESQLPTSKGKNKGNGRKMRRLREAKFRDFLREYELSNGKI